MRVISQGDLGWAVMDGETVVKADFATMESAWAFIDRNLSYTRDRTRPGKLYTSKRYEAG